MNWAHVHLVVNEVPVLTSVFAALFFLVALRANSRDIWTHAGMIMLGIASLAGLAAFLTGDPALHVVDGQLHTSGRALSEHHVRAVAAISVAGATAVGGIAALIRRRMTGVYSHGFVWILFFATLASAATLSWTGLAGGRISHPELQLPGDRDEGPAHHH